MPSVTVKTGGTHQFGSPGEAAEFLDLFLEKAGFVKNFPWEARLEKTAHCSWDSPPVRVVGYKHWVIYLRVKPSINATVDHFVSLLIPDGSGYAAETVYRQLKGLVKGFNRFVRTNGHRKKTLEPAMEREAIPTVPSPAPAGPTEDGVCVNGAPTPEPLPDDAAAVNGTVPPSAAETSEVAPTPTFDSLNGVTPPPGKAALRPDAHRPRLAAGHARRAVVQEDPPARVRLDEPPAPRHLPDPGLAGQDRLRRQGLRRKRRGDQLRSDSARPGVRGLGVEGRAGGGRRAAPPRRSRRRTSRSRKSTTARCSSASATRRRSWPTRAGAWRRTGRNTESCKRK